MRFGPWMLLISAWGCKGDDTDQPTGDTGDTQVIDTSPPTREERIEIILGLIPTGDIAAGQASYEGFPGCHECHLLQGQGGGPYPALTERLPLIDDTRSVVVVLDGLPPPVSSPTDPGMPAYGEVAEWTDQRIADTIAYINSAFDTGAR